MATEVTFHDGQVSVYDEEREVRPSGPGLTEVSSRYLGPTPAKDVPAEDVNVRRDRLRAELAALEAE